MPISRVIAALQARSRGPVASYMWKRRNLCAVCLSALTVILGGCSTETPGVARSVAPTQAAPAADGGGTTSAAGAPRLSPAIDANRLDLSGAKQSPCTLLPDSFMTTYGNFKPGEARTEKGGPSCVFGQRTIDSPLVSAAILGDSGGLEGIYARRSSFPEFVPGKVRGYPSVALPQEQGRGTCAVIVGVNDTDVISIYVGITPSRPSYDDPCAVASPIATEALREAGG